MRRIDLPLGSSHPRPYFGRAQTATAVVSSNRTALIKITLPHLERPHGGLSLRVYHGASKRPAADLPSAVSKSSSGSITISDRALGICGERKLGCPQTLRASGPWRCRGGSGSRSRRRCVAQDLTRTGWLGGGGKVRRQKITQERKRHRFHHRRVCRTTMECTIVLLFIKGRGSSFSSRRI